MKMEYTGNCPGEGRKCGKETMGEGRTILLNPTDFLEVFPGSRGEIRRKIGLRNPLSEEAIQ